MRKPLDFYAAVLVGFAAVALLLGAVGVYGVTSYTVSLERRQIGGQLALGAERPDVLGRILGRGLRPVAVGLLAGTLAALALAEWLEGMLYGVSSRDPWVPTAVPLLLVASALAALWLPVRRAARLDPLEALRAD